MFDKRSRQATEEFYRGLQDVTRNHAFDTIELLSSELADLGEVLRSEIGVSFKGAWLHANLTYGASFNRAGERILGVVVTPLSTNGLELIVANQKLEEEGMPRLRKEYNKLHKPDTVNALFYDVRGHIMDAILGPQPVNAGFHASGRREVVASHLRRIFNGIELDEGEKVEYVALQDHIRAKYSGSGLSPQQAYLDLIST